MAKVALLVLNRTSFALRVSAIEHIIQTPRTFPIPLLRGGFLGVFLHNGKPAPMFDLWRIFGNERWGQADSPLTVLCGTEFGLIGVPSDQVVRIVDEERGEMIEPGDSLRTVAFRQVFQCSGVRYPLLDIEALVASTYR